jgi:hypothetical protein
MLLGVLRATTSVTFFSGFLDGAKATNRSYDRAIAKGCEGASPQKSPQSTVNRQFRLWFNSACLWKVWLPKTDTDPNSRLENMRGASFSSLLTKIRSSNLWRSRP